MTERFVKITYEIGRVYDDRTGERLPPAEERRILDIMNKHMERAMEQIAVDKKATCKSTPNVD